MERFEMGQEELDKLNWLKRAKDGSITQRTAAEKMGVTDRWVRKLLTRMAEQGDGVVIHALRGKPSNRQIAEEIRKRALHILNSQTGTISGRHLRANSWPSVTTSTSVKRRCGAG